MLLLYIITGITVLLSATSLVLDYDEGRGLTIESAVLSLLAALLLGMSTMAGPSKSPGAALMAPRMPAQCSMLPHGELLRPSGTESSSPTRSTRKRVAAFAGPGGNVSVNEVADRGVVPVALASIHIPYKASCYGKRFESY